MPMTFILYYLRSQLSKVTECKLSLFKTNKNKFFAGLMRLWLAGKYLFFLALLNFLLNLHIDERIFMNAKRKLEWQ